MSAKLNSNAACRVLVLALLAAAVGGSVASVKDSEHGPTAMELKAALRATHDFGGVLRLEELTGVQPTGRAAELLELARPFMPAPEEVQDGFTGERGVVITRSVLLTDRDGRLRIERRPLYLKGFEDSIITVEIWDEQSNTGGNLRGDVVSKGGPFPYAGPDERSRLLAIDREPHQRNWASQGYFAAINFVIEVLQSEPDVRIEVTGDHALVTSTSSRFAARIELRNYRLVEMIYYPPYDLRVEYVFEGGNSQIPPHPDVIRKFRPHAGSESEYLGESRFRNMRVDYTVQSTTFTRLKQASILGPSYAGFPTPIVGAASDATASPTGLKPSKAPLSNELSSSQSVSSAVFLGVGAGLLILAGVVAYWRRAR